MLHCCAHHRFRKLLALLLGGMFAGGAASTQAEVVVLANRTTRSLTFTLFPADEPSRSMTLLAGDARPVFFETSIRIQYGQGLAQRKFQLAPSSAYYFGQRLLDDTLQLERIGLGAHDYGAPLEKSSARRRTDEPAVIPVKILVDEDELTHRRIWEARLRKRVADASELLLKHCGVQLKVVAVATWESDDKQHDFSRSLREFEREVKPRPAALAIGFSSQYKLQRGRIHLGGTRGVLHPYILLKERARTIQETERLELLVHEVGHYLGASHSPEPGSVMRPLLSGGQQRRIDARIQFDPVNTLLMSLVGEEIRHYGARNMLEFSPATKKRMLEIYGVLRIALPNDPAAAQYEQMITRAAAPPLVADTQLVLGQLMQLATSQQAPTKPTAENAADAEVPHPDALTNLYVRRAASSALQIDASRRLQAFLFALGIFVDDTDMLRKFPLTATLVRLVESESDHRARVRQVKKLTMQGRRDLAKHFFLSAHARLVIGAAAAQGVGLAKELLDAQYGTGFSYADMVANRAGVIFAEQLLAKNISLSEVAKNFQVADYLPSIADLAEGLRVEALQDQLAETAENSLRAELKRIEARVRMLPAYREQRADQTESARGTDY